MRTVKINDVKVKIFEKRDLVEKLGFNEERTKNVMVFQKKFPELLLNGIEGCIVDAYNLWIQLDRPYSKFSHWIKRKVFGERKNSNFQLWNENKDFKEVGTIVHPLSEGQKIINYMFTLDMARHVATIENTSVAFGIRNALWDIFDAVREMDKWILIREPEREGYLELCKHLKNYHEDNGKDKISSFIYSNEADMLNVALLGKRAKEIKEFLNVRDNNTREHLNIEVNKALYELQLIDVGLIIGKIDYEQRKSIIESSCKVKYSNLKNMIFEELDM